MNEKNQNNQENYLSRRDLQNIINNLNEQLTQVNNKVSEFEKINKSNHYSLNNSSQKSKNNNSSREEEVQNLIYHLNSRNEEIYDLKSKIKELENLNEKIKKISKEELISRNSLILESGDYNILETNDVNELRAQLENKEAELAFANLKITEIEKKLILSQSKFNSLKKIVREKDKELKILKNEDAELENQEIEEKIAKIENLAEPIATSNPLKSRKVSAYEKEMDHRCAKLKGKLSKVKCKCCEELRGEIIEVLTDLQFDTLQFHDAMVAAQISADYIAQISEKDGDKLDRLREQIRVLVDKAASESQKVAAVKAYYEDLLWEWEAWRRRPKDAEAIRFGAYKDLKILTKFVKRESEFFNKQFLHLIKNFTFAVDEGRFANLFKELKLNWEKIVVGFDDFFEERYLRGLRSG